MSFYTRCVFSLLIQIVFAIATQAIVTFLAIISVESVTVAGIGIAIPGGKSEDLKLNTEGRLEPLLLTPFLAEGKYAEARQAAKVDLERVLGRIPSGREDAKWNWRPLPVAESKRGESFSGYLTVNQTWNSNLFFWFFPAQNKSPLESPLILFLSGGPGSPSSTVAFSNGPLDLDKDLKVKWREQCAWTDDHSVLYIDSPVGSGFSFTKDDRGYARSDGEIVDNLYEALSQFFLIFSSFKSRPFYIAGHSYSGKVALKLGKRIHDDNHLGSLLTLDSKMKLRGVLLLSPLINPMIQIPRASVLHTFALIDKETKEELLAFERIAEEMARKKNYRGAVTLIDAAYGIMFNESSIFNVKTGYESIFEGVLSPKVSLKRVAPTKIIQTREFRQALHVGEKTSFGVNSPKLLETLLPGMFESSQNELETLLWSTHNYQVMILNGQMDMGLPWSPIEEFLSKLNWVFSNSFPKQQRKILFTRDKNTTAVEMAGYFKEHHNLFQGVVQFAGHYLWFDQPLYTLEYLMRLTSSAHA